MTRYAAAPLWAHAFVWALSLATPAPASPAQTEASARTIAGVVVDVTGGTVAGATVTLDAGGAQRRTLTGRAGEFMFDNVPDGRARLTASFEQFRPATVTVDGPRRDLRVVLQPLPVTENLTVHAPAVTALRTPAASRTDTLLRDVPQAVSVIPRELIAEQTMRSMADVVNYVPGVGMAQGEGHRDAPIFRGNTSTADFFVDGLRDDTQYLRDLYNLERIEVLKGPNGMLFGRGGVGGVINRVTRQADWMPVRELGVQGGSWGYRRLTGDLGNAITSQAAARLTAMYENSGTFRDRVDIERYGVNPTAAFALRPGTMVRAGYELFHDERTTDRGIPSWGDRPLDVEPSTFFGSTTLNHARVTVHAVSGALDHRAGPHVTIRSRVRVADYEKFYSNLVPGAVSAGGSDVTLTGYNSGTGRRNVFSQTDLIVSARTGRIGHTLLTGVELGRQVTDNRRLTAFFPSIGPATTSISVPLANPVTGLPVDFRATGSDANNRGIATTAGVYAQDQMALSERFEAIVGARYDRFAVDLLDRRTEATFEGDDGLVSPRLALIYKPLAPVTFYTSYTKSYLPRAGEQLASLSLTNQALDPEEFTNLEAGAKWEITPSLSFTTAVYRLNHGNVVVRDALDPTVSHLVDAERTRGLELEIAGSVSERWTLQGGYAYQNGEITRSLSAAVAAGSRLAQVPRHTFSLWNRVLLTRVWGAGLGVISRSDSFAAADNAVVLPGYARVDAAVFAAITPRVHAQVNVENLFDRRYYWSAHNNNNIAPGSPRAVRVALVTGF
jgi:catecholate siderophore receptor